MGGNSPMSGCKTANPLRSLACFQEKPRNSDKVEAKVDVTPTTPPRKWRTLKSHGSILEFVAEGVSADSGDVFRVPYAASENFESPKHEHISSCKVSMSIDFGS